jgi:hypothetical protein
MEGIVVTIIILGTIIFLTFAFIMIDSGKKIKTSTFEPKFLSEVFTPSRVYDQNTYLAIDEIKNKIAFLIDGKVKLFSLEKVVDVKLTIDKQIESSKGCGMAIITGLVCGGFGIFTGSLAGVAIGFLIGAVLGGIFTSSKQEEKINKIELKITIEDTVNPLISVPFVGMATAEKWEGIIKTTIQKLKVPLESKSGLDEKLKVSVADELKKLHQLMLDGILSEEKFQIQKSKLILAEQPRNS